MFRFRSKADWRESAPHIFLLSKFQSAREEYKGGWLGGHDWDEWTRVLKESPQKAIRRFLKDGALEQARLEGCLAHKFKISELKGMLRQHGLSVSGSKADLIDRLIQIDRAGMMQAVSGLPLLQCSSQGQEAVDRYLAHVKQRETELEQQIIEALQQREFGRIPQLVHSFDGEQVFPEGVSVGGSQGRALLNSIFTQTPNVLAQLSDEQLEPLRIGAGMLVLGWTPGQVRKWLPSDLETGLQVSNWGAALMLHSHAHYSRQMQQAHETNKEGWFEVEIEIQTANDDHVCEACRTIASEKYQVSEVPELPYVKCTSEDGCRCSVSVRPVLPG